jgi:Lysylphosphatidylglycerol synthase TM region
MTLTGHKLRYRTILLGFGSVLFAYLLFHLGAAKIFSLLLGIGWYFGLIAVTYAGHQLVRAFAYWKCATAHGHSSYWDMLRIRLSGEAIQFLTFTGPFLAEPAKMWLLQKHGLPPKQAMAATIAEYLIYSLASAAFAIAALIFLLSNFALSKVVTVAAKIIVYAMSAFLLAAACAIVWRIYLIGAIIRFSKRLPLIGKQIHLRDQDVRATEDLLFIVLRDRPLRLLFVLSAEFAAQALLVLELFILLRATGEPFSIVKPFLIEGASKFISLAFFFIPGQVGAAEGTYALIFKTVGLPASAGFALAVARRLRSVMVAGVGLAMMPFWKDLPAA